MTIPLFSVHMPPKEELMPKLEEVLYSGYIGQGPKVEEFEEKLGAYLQNTNVLTTSSGTAALQLAILTMGLGVGDSVVITAMSCLATSAPFAVAGVDLIWTDIDPHTGNVDPLDVERKIQKNTKAIVVVHWGGRPCDMDAIMAIGSKYGIKVVEDAAHAFGSSGIQKADFTVYSFQAIKTMTTVDGGALVLKSPDDYRRAKLLRWYGLDRETDKAAMRCEEDVSQIGLKLHMNDVTATYGLVQMPYVDNLVRAQQRNAKTFSDAIDSKCFYHTYDPKSSYWLYTILLPNEALRLRFGSWLKAAGIMANQVHVRNDIHSCYLEFKRTPLPGVDEFCARQICIPVHWSLSESDVRTIVGACYSFGVEVFYREN